MTVAHQRTESALTPYRNNNSLNQSTHRSSVDLEIKEIGTFQRLKDTYEKDMGEIKQLQAEICNNNKEIKEILKQSASLKNDKGEK